MKLQEALKIILDEGDTEFIRCPFCLYARLADFVGADYCERDNLRMLFQIDKQVFLVRRLMETDVGGAACIREEFSSQTLFSAAEFGEIFDMVASVLVKGYLIPSEPDEPSDFDYMVSYVLASEEKAEAEEKVENHIADESGLGKFTVSELKAYCRTHGLRGYSSLNKADLVHLIMGVPPEAQTPRVSRTAQAAQMQSAPQTAQTYYGSYGPDFWDILPWLGGALGIAILIAGAVCLGVFANRIPWTVWQWIIGAAGGLVACGAGFLFSLVIGWFLEEAIGVDGGYLWAIHGVIAAIAIANIVLSFVYGGSYTIIFYWMSGYLLLASVIGTIDSFIEYEAGAGVFGIADAVVLVGMLAVRILMQVL